MGTFGLWGGGTKKESKIVFWKVEKKKKKKAKRHGGVKLQGKGQKGSGYYRKGFDHAGTAIARGKMLTAGEASSSGDGIRGKNLLGAVNETPSGRKKKEQKVLGDLTRTEGAEKRPGWLQRVAI